MRRAIAIETVLAIALAFLLAPFEHVHTDSDHPDHAHAGEVHAHLFAVHPHAQRASTTGITIDDDDDDHAHARSLNTFTLWHPQHLPMFVPSPGPALPRVRTWAIPRVEIVEARANGPPGLEQTPPRAPPL